MSQLSLAQLNGANDALLEQLEELDPKVQLRIANGLWTARQAGILPEFIAVNQKDYQAAVASLDFHQPAALETINSFASQKTAGKITHFLQPPLDPLLRVVALNVIYFKGGWTVPFDKKLTQPLAFTLPGGQQVQQLAMRRSGTFDYYEDSDLQALRLPYGSGKVAMFVLLPKGPLSAFFQQLTARNWARWMEGFQSRKGRVQIPRWKLENKYDFGPALASMGMAPAFGREADFSGISTEPLYISWVKQQTYVEVIIGIGHHG